MKPTSPAGLRARSRDSQPTLQDRKSPATDWSYQTSAADLRGGSSPFRRGSRRSFEPSFYSLSQGFFSAEANRESRIEAALFAVIVAIALWPMAQAVQAAFALSK